MITMKILVTGGGGFQGSHLTERLVQLGHQVTVLSTYSKQSKGNLAAVSGEIETVWGSITDPQIIKKTVRDQDAIFHLAALINVDDSIATPLDFLGVNVLGTCHILEAVKENGSRLIFASTCEVYGNSTEIAADDNTALRPHSPYAASKAAADRLCYAYFKTYGINLSIVRPCNIYGPRQKTGSGGALIPILVERALTQQPLTVFGTGIQTREYMHVSDLVTAYELILNGESAGEVLNVGSGEMPSVNQIAEFIANRVGSTVNNGPARAGEVEGFKLDSSKIKAMGFSPSVPFWEGLEAYIEWRQAQPASF